MLQKPTFMWRFYSNSLGARTFGLLLPVDCTAHHTTIEENRSKDGTFEIYLCSESQTKAPCRIVVPFVGQLGQQINNSQLGR